MKKDKTLNERSQVGDDQELLSRRAYLLSLKKWSKAVIAGALFSGLSSCSSSWSNRSGGSWANRGGWVNRSGSWANRNRGGRTWANRR
jgi:hypothetical protein